MVAQRWRSWRRPSSGQAGGPGGMHHDPAAGGAFSFCPLRLLGSYFHIAMNGMVASDKIFRLLDLPEPEQGTQCVPHSFHLHGGGSVFPTGRGCMRWTLQVPQGKLHCVWGRAAAEKHLSPVSLWGAISTMQVRRRRTCPGPALAAEPEPEHYLHYCPRARPGLLRQLPKRRRVPCEVLEQVRLGYPRSGQGPDYPRGRAGQQSFRRARLALVGCRRMTARSIF